MRPWQRSQIRMREWVGLRLDEKRWRLHCFVSKSRQKSRWREREHEGPEPEKENWVLGGENPMEKPSVEWRYILTKVDVRDQTCLTFAFLEMIGKVFHFHTWIGGWNFNKFWKLCYVLQIWANGPALQQHRGNYASGEQGEHEIINHYCDSEKH